jgi:glyoxylase-like metal-dependent hydrolase (beta-lactamase superfamily II)
MKQLHRPDLFGWSAFDETRNIDFNTTVWIRDDGNVVIDPMPMSSHDQRHLESLGGAAWVVMTNSDHIRSAREVAAAFGARLAAPAGERETWPFPCDAWLKDRDELISGLVALACEGSKTPGELVLRLGRDTLVTGDLIRAHMGGSLMMLPDAKLSNHTAACRSIARLAELRGIESVLVGDGWHLFSGGSNALGALTGL